MWTITATISSIGKKPSTTSRNSYSNPRQLDSNKFTPNSSFSLKQLRMRYVKHALSLLTGGLLVLKAFAAEGPPHPLQILYLGPVSKAGNGGGFGSGANPRANYVYLPG